jgi:radical SAM protein with 4Fe4S-binding SPASM domain
MNAPLTAAEIAQASFEAPEPLVSWIRDQPKRPICDVPWLGGSVVLSNGDVYFCCFSGTKVGNVNETSFQDIWNGGTMQGIRQALIEGQLPTECRSGSCPIYRRDDRHYVVERMNSPHMPPQADGTRQLDDVIRETRASLSTVRLQLSKGCSAQSLQLSLRLDMATPDLVADLFVAIDGPTGNRRFLPDHLFAVPYAAEVDCSRTLAIELDTHGLGDFMESPGLYRLCAALFEPRSNPNILANCYWSAMESFRLG